MRLELMDICRVAQALKFTYLLFVPAGSKHFAYAKSLDGNQILRAYLPNMPELLPLNTFYVGSPPSTKNRKVKVGTYELTDMMDALKFEGALSVVFQEDVEDVSGDMSIEFEKLSFIAITSSSGEVKRIPCIQTSSQSPPEPAETAHVLDITAKASIMKTIASMKSDGAKMFSFTHNDDGTLINFHKKGDQTTSMPLGIEGDELSYDTTKLTVASVYLLNYAYPINPFLSVMKAAKTCRVSVHVRTESRNIEYRFRKYIGDEAIAYSVQSSYGFVLDPAKNQTFELDGKSFVA